MTEGPYKLPPGWRWVKLGEVCKEIIMGQSPPSSTYNTEMRGLPFFQGKADFGEIYPKPRVWCSSPLKVAQPGDVLISVRAPVGPTNLANIHCCIGRGLAALRAGENLEGAWLFYYLRHAEDDLAGSGMGSTFKAITRKELQNFPLPLPPLEEQRRIVARVEELMSRIQEAKRLHQEAKEDAGRLMQAALAEVFPRPGAQLPPGWWWVRLGEVAWRESTTLRPDSQPNAVFPYIGMGHIAPGQWEEPIPVELKGSEIKSQVIAFRPGLVLYGKLRPYLNKVFVPSFEGVASTEFVPIATKDDVFDPRYLGAFLRSQDFVAYATRNTTGSRQPRVRLDALWNVPLPLPPLEEQRRIVAYLEALQEKVTALRSSQEAITEDLRRLEQSILDRAFRGEL